MKSSLSTPVLGLLAHLLFANATFAQGLPGEALQTRNLHGDLVLSLSKQGYVVERPGSEPLALSTTAPGAQMTSFEGAGEGWFAAGSTLGADGQNGLVVLGADGAGAKRLPSPKTAGQVIFDAVLDVAGGKLRGMAWLEGERIDGLELRAARFDGERWLDPVVVSPKGAGSQLALSGAALADGSWLVVWSAFDGEDDEILWSRFTAGGWSPPQPVAANNHVPDITPSLSLTNGGALLAWSRYDGNDYRVTTARFDGEAWSEPQLVGPRGSVSPSFGTTPSASFLLFQTAHPRSWTIFELDAEGKKLREARSEVFRLERPLLAKVADDGIELRWPGELGRKSARALWLQPSDSAATTRQ